MTLPLCPKYNETDALQPRLRYKWAIRWTGGLPTKASYVAYLVSLT